VSVNLEDDCAYSEQDDAWGTFNSASPARSPDVNAENPFGDDNFVPAVPSMRQDPLTPHDWASEFDREFSSGEPASIWRADGAPAIVVPNLDEGDEPSTPGSSWSLTGEEEGEDLPPTTSPTIPPEPVLGKNSPAFPSVPTMSAGPSSAPETSPLPIRSPSTAPIDPPVTERSPRYGEPISPPDPALLAAATEEAPLGPGVSSDTHITSGGMLEKEVGGQKITVPADEIILGLDEAIDKRKEL